MPPKRAPVIGRSGSSRPAHFAPSDPLRSLLVDQLIAAAWRLRRARLFERLILEQRADDVEDLQKAQAPTSHTPPIISPLPPRGHSSGKKLPDPPSPTRPPLRPPSH